jgi:ABC-type multidrug transport system ATPase subunit
MWGGMAVAFAIDALLVVYYLWFKFKVEPARNRARGVAGRRELVLAAKRLEATASANPLSVIVSAAPASKTVEDVVPLEVGAADASAVRSSANPLRISAQHKQNLGIEDWDTPTMSPGPAVSKSRSDPSSPTAYGASGGSAFSRIFSDLRRRVTSLPPGVVMGAGGKVRTKSFYGAAALDFASGAAQSPSAENSASAEAASGDDAVSVDLDTAASAAAILQDAFRRCNKGQNLSVAFKGLTLTLPAPINKTILSDVSGSIGPGRVTAILGPSGAGKTTFLNVLMGRLARTAGELLINGSPDEMSQYGRITGFVPQEDVMLTELTVRENIAHSARVRLPREGWSSADVDLLVTAVIEVLGLRGCADTPADRISGGQRKRTNIGIELATAPSAIFLDEPTSGLDATAALQVCNTLRSIADLGLTVVSVIHQPRSEIFRSFDDLLLLAPGGKTVFQGSQRDILSYFNKVGLEFSSDGNVADDLLDFVAGRHPASAELSVLEPIIALTPNLLLSDALRRVRATDASASTVQLRGAEVPAYLAARWHKEADSSATVKVFDSGARAALKLVMADRGATILSQAILCHDRYVVQQYRTPSWLALELGVCCMAGSIMGLAATAVKELYAGVLVPPYTSLSPSPIESLLPSLGLYRAAFDCSREFRTPG